MLILFFPYSYCKDIDKLQYIATLLKKYFVFFFIFEMLSSIF